MSMKPISWYYWSSSVVLCRMMSRYSTFAIEVLITLGNGYDTITGNRQGLQFMQLLHYIVYSTVPPYTLLPSSYMRKIFLLLQPPLSIVNNFVHPQQPLSHAVVHVNTSQFVTLTPDVIPTQLL